MKGPLKKGDFNVPLFPGGGIGWFSIEDADNNYVCSVYILKGETTHEHEQRTMQLINLIERGLDQEG